MSHIHRFLRPDIEPDSRKVGDIYSPEHRQYDEGTRYAYTKGAHDLVLFWPDPSSAEVKGFRDQPVDLGLFTHPHAAFLLYKIQDVCEWSDVAFHVQRVPEAERELPAEPSGERARLRMTLVNATDGIIVAKRLLSLDKVMTQALRHIMLEQASTAFAQTLYDLAVQETYARFPDSDALIQAAEVVEPALG